MLDQIGIKSYTVLCEEYRIGCFTIFDIKKEESSLTQYKVKAKVMKLGKRGELETTLCL